MPVFSRKQLRRNLGLFFIKDTTHIYQYNSAINVNGGTGTIPANTGSINVSNNEFADLSLSGQDLYQGAWIYLEGSTAISDTLDNWWQYRVATFNAGSGSFISWQFAKDNHNPNGDFEIHQKVSPHSKNQAIDDTLQRIRIRQEVGINTVDGALVYTIDGAASPNYLEKILDVHLMANPNNSLDLDLRHMQDWQVVTTATGRELRLKWGVKGSQQIVFDAILIPSLGSGENATINLPDERWILAGAAMRCYDFMIQNAPGQQVSQLMQRRAEWAAEYTRLSAKFMPTYEEPIRLHDVVRGMTPRPWDSASNFW